MVNNESASVAMGTCSTQTQKNWQKNHEKIETLLMAVNRDKGTARIK
jgi:hypothetical protein